MKDMQNTKRIYSITIPEEEASNLLKDVISYKKPVPVEINGVEVYISSKHWEQIEETNKFEQNSGVFNVEDTYASIHSDKASHLNFKEAEQIAKEEHAKHVLDEMKKE